MNATHASGVSSAVSSSAVGRADWTSKLGLAFVERANGVCGASAAIEKSIILLLLGVGAMFKVRGRVKVHNL
jgi:hypothetical protein